MLPTALSFRSSNSSMISQLSVVTVSSSAGSSSSASFLLPEVDAEATVVVASKTGAGLEITLHCPWLRRNDFMAEAHCW